MVYSEPLFYRNLHTEAHESVHNRRGQFSLKKIFAAHPIWPYTRETGGRLFMAMIEDMVTRKTEAAAAPFKNRNLKTFVIF